MNNLKDNLLTIQSMDMNGNGIAKNNSKVVFVNGALPNEIVSINLKESKQNLDFADLKKIYKKSSQRIKPKCIYFENCGGCNLQHLNINSQISIKQRFLEDSLWHLAKVKPENILSPIIGKSWNYRSKTKLAVNYLNNKNQVLIGFKENKTNSIVNIKSCKVLDKNINLLLEPLHKLMSELKNKECTQIKLSSNNKTTILSLNNFKNLSNVDKDKLNSFANFYKIKLDLQEEKNELFYKILEFNLKIFFNNNNFTQINFDINNSLIKQAIKLLDIQENEIIIDWFCGLGNFTLPIAIYAKSVIGVEGLDSLIKQANYNKNQNNLVNINFIRQNLFKIDVKTLMKLKADKWLIDPPRDGAFTLCKSLFKIRQNNLIKNNKNIWKLPEKIIYISCNPSTLARDTKELIKANYKCKKIGIINMFPHTSHVESIAVFELNKDYSIAKNN